MGDKDSLKKIKKLKEIEFKPEKTPFVYFNFLQVFIPLLFILIVSTLVLLFLDSQIFILLPIFLFILINLLYYAYLSIRYRKETYIFKDNRIIMKGGSFFSDYETELVVKKITQVSMNLPVLEHYLFKTGSIDFKAAGSSGVEISLANIANPNDFYKTVMDIMENNGFSLKRDELLQKENPNVLGMVINTILGALSATLVFFVAFLDAAFVASLAVVPFWLWLLIIPLVTVIIALVLIYHYMKIKRTTYYLYEDMIEYTSLFLTKQYSFIPIENLANCEIDQNFWQKLLDLYNIKLSSQGSQNNIAFTMIKNGVTMRDHITHLIGVTPSLTDVVQDQKKPEVEKRERAKTGYTQELKMKFLRMMFLNLVSVVLIVVAVLFLTITAVLFLPEGVYFLVFLIPIAIYAIPAFVIYVAYQYIIVLFTTFKINKESVSQEFNFLVSRNREFTIDKTTSVIFKENIIDRLLNTVTIVFTSIGSSSNVTFSYIDKDIEVIENILLKMGFEKEKPVEKLQSRFSFKEMFKGNLFFSLFFLIFIILLLISSFFYPILLIPFTLIFLGFLLVSFYRRRYYRFSKMTFYDSYVHFQRGWLFKQEHYVLYSNVKDLISVKYPSSTKGRLTFNVAGENFVGNPSGQNQELNLVSSGFTMNYVSNIVDVHNESEVFLNRYPFSSNKVVSSEPDLQTNLKTFKPVLSNSLLVLILISILVPPLIVLLPISIPMTVIVLRRITYKIQSERVLKDEGVFFKKKTSVLYNRIDHITKQQGLLNKIFSNGNLAIYTVGSGTPELVIKNVKNHDEIYSKLEDVYR